MQPPASGDGHAHPASKRRNAMTVGVVIGRSPRRGFLRTAVGGFSMPPIVGWIWDILQACSQAADAAHYYEQLRPLSDEALADRGLTREDIPRAVLRKLSDGI